MQPRSEELEAVFCGYINVDVLKMNYANLVRYANHRYRISFVTMAPLIVLQAP